MSTKNEINSAQRGGGYTVNLITQYNINEYIDISDIISYIDIKNKNYKTKTVPFQVLSDIIRFRLLSKYGGWWMDSTIFLANDTVLNLPEKYHLPFFTIHLGYTKNLCSYEKWTSFFLAGVPNHPIFSFVNEMLTYHIQKYHRVLSYHLTDYALAVGSVNIPWLHKCIESMPISNPYVLWLAKHADECFDPFTYKMILQHTNVFKMNWRLKFSDNNKSNWNNIKAYDFRMNVIDNHDHA